MLPKLKIRQTSISISPLSTIKFYIYVYIYIYRQKKEIVGGRPHHMQTKESLLENKSSHDYYLLYGK
jgi:hypothetical protein